ncbi:MAG: hypothetical protein RLZZ232_3081 [Planctomycetota bacterium]|jgi:hypothetical protein
MSLRDQFAEDVCAILNTDELGEQATWTNSAGLAIPRVVRLIEQPDRQTIRRAHLWTPSSTTAVSAGDTFRVKRGNVTTTWVVMFTDPAETALQRSYCHLQLTEFVTLKQRRMATGPAKAERAFVDSEVAQVRAKWFLSSAEISATQSGKRRAMVGEYYCILQSLRDVNVADTITNADGENYRIDRVENQFNRVDLPYLICSRCDT